MNNRKKNKQNKYNEWHSIDISDVRFGFNWARYGVDLSVKQGFLSL